MVTGLFQSPSITFGATTLNNTYVGDDCFIAKYDAACNELWAKSAGGFGFDDGESITTDTIGNIFVTGWFSSPFLTFDNTTLDQVR